MMHSCIVPGFADLPFVMTRLRGGGTVVDVVTEVVPTALSQRRVVSSRGE